MGKYVYRVHPAINFGRVGNSEEYYLGPETPAGLPDDPYGEDLRNTLTGKMRIWQKLFTDANPDQINADRGPEVVSGRYWWPPRAGEAAAPSADFNPRARSGR